MATDKKLVKDTEPRNPLFDKGNYMLMAVGGVLLLLGFFLMMGGRNEDPNVFNDSDVYSPIRITVAPLLIIAGFVVEAIAIMRKPKH